MDDCLTQCKEIIAEQFRKNELDVSFDEASKESNSSSPRKQQSSISAASEH
jgi:hypothetical protein